MNNENKIGNTVSYTDPCSGKVIQGVVTATNGGWRAKAIRADINDYYTVKLKEPNSSGCDTVIILKND